jgi:hypothetical protein
MGLKEVLSRMKIVELESTVGPGPAPTASTAAPGAKTGATADVAQILGSLPAPPEIDERVLPADGGAAELPDFPAIYRAAGIADPPHGYTAYKVLEILSSAEFAHLEPRAKAAALSGFLKMNPAGPVPIADVVQDAVRRDQALDKFEELLRAKLAARSSEVERENAALQAEIDALARRNREHMEANRRALDEERARLAGWQARKRIEERKLSDAVGPFVEANPITVEPPVAEPARPPVEGEK